MKPKTRQEIAEEFNISRATLYRLLKREGINLPGGLLYAKEQEIVYRRLGIENLSSRRLEGKVERDAK